ncbi:MAG: NADH-quinone oxidoreductase subunit L [Deltaproteobacteria bacterium]|nr:NADH-quinone oxidoreductase subunit L [Deltaproteobacteria bacterium]
MQLALIPFFPLLSFVALIALSKRLSENQVTTIGVAGIVLSFVSALLALILLPENYREILWTWIPFYTSESNTATIQMGFYLDSLSAVMLMVVTFISSLIALFATSYMEDDAEIGWFFACINLFVASMLILVLGDNLLVLFLGWEGVGLCSYLLIGFWRNDIENGWAAMKAFLATRIGDVFLLFGIFLIFSSFGTLSIQEVLQLAENHWQTGSLIATYTALCILMGAVGKSAQIPLQIWLADAMRGPTPVSALIHAATMVTAGVYLIARMGGIFELSPVAQTAVLWIGALTLLLAGVAALLQNDIKRVLAYSTMSQLGYMFLALGAGAYSAGIFHLVTHACFKALLFLAAGAVGHLRGHTYSLLKVNNLRYEIPWVFWAFLIGLSSLSALPFVTSGFYSKELILSQVFESSYGGTLAWAAGAFGALLTGFYSFRLFMLLFYSKGLSDVSQFLKKGASDFPPLAKGGQGGFSNDLSWRMKVPLGALMVLAVIAGFFPITQITDASVIHFVAARTASWPEWIAVSLGLLGIGIGVWKLYPMPITDNIWMRSLGIEALYERVLLSPYRRLSYFMKGDPIRAVYHLGVWLSISVQNLLQSFQTGRTLQYVSAFVAAMVVLLAFWAVI